MQLRRIPRNFLVYGKAGPRVNAPQVGPLMRACIRRGAHALDGGVPPQVPAKAQGLPKFIVGWIDGGGGWRYSQAQIPDLVAYAIPRIHKAAQSIGSALPGVCRFPAQPVDCYRLVSRIAHVHDAAQRLQVLKGHGRVPSGCRAAKRPHIIAALAAEGMQVAENTFPQRLKPWFPSFTLVARLKSCPFKADNFTSTSPRRTGGYRNL